jgi:hypothetical protein
MAETRTLVLYRFEPSNATAVPYTFKAYPAEHADGATGGESIRFSDPPAVGGFRADYVVASVDYTITFNVTVVGNPQETSIYFGHALPRATLIYKRTGGVTTLNAAPQVTVRVDGQQPQPLVLIWWTRAGVGVDPDVANHIEIEVTGVTCVATVEIRDKTWEVLGDTLSMSYRIDPASSGRRDLLIWTIPPLPPEWEVSSGIQLEVGWSATWSWGDADGFLNLLADHLDTGPFLMRVEDLSPSPPVEYHGPVATGRMTTWPTAYAIEVAWNHPNPFAYARITVTAWIKLTATIRFKGSGTGGGGGSTGGASVVGGDGASAAERLLGLVTVDAVGFAGLLPVDSGADTPAVFPDLHWVNGFEEGSFVFGSTVDLDGAWSTVDDVGLAGGVAIVAGFHGASQYAVRFTCLADNSKRGGVCKKAIPTTTTGTLYARLYVKPGSSPSTSMTIFEWAVNAGVAPFYAARVSWLSTLKVRLQDRAGSSADSAGTIGTGDRLELRVILGGGGGCELRIYTGNSTTPRETVTLSGNPASGQDVITAVWQGTVDAGQSGTIDMDSVGISKVGWLGPATVLIATPVQDLSVLWGRVGSGGQNAEVVDDYPGTLDDTNYLVAATPNRIDRYAWRIPRAEFAGAASVVQAVIGMMRARYMGTPETLRQILWDEADRKLTAGFWTPGTSVPTNVNAIDTLAINPDRRALTTLAQWQIGAETDADTGAEIRAMLCYANLDVLEIA